MPPYDLLQIFHKECIESICLQILKWTSSTRRVSVILKDLGILHGLAVHSYMLYYGDRTYETISALDLRDPRNITVVKRNVRSVSDITVVYDRYLKCMIMF